MPRKNSAVRRIKDAKRRMARTQNVPVSRVSDWRAMKWAGVNPKKIQYPQQYAQPTGEVRILRGEPIEKALRKLKKKVTAEKGGKERGRRRNQKGLFPPMFH